MMHANDEIHRRNLHNNQPRQYRAVAEGTSEVEVLLDRRPTRLVVWRLVWFDAAVALIYEGRIGSGAGKQGGPFSF